MAETDAVVASAAMALELSDVCVLCVDSWSLRAAFECHRCRTPIGNRRYCRTCALEENKCASCGQDFKAPHEYLTSYVDADFAKTLALIAVYADEKNDLGDTEVLIRDLQRRHNKRSIAAQQFLAPKEPATKTPYVTARFLVYLAATTL